MENRSHRSTVKNAVFYDQPVVRAITNTTAGQQLDTRQDEDPKGGQFKVSDLTDGTYTLKETSAPNGFDVSETKTYTIVIENGQVTSSGLPSAGNIENSRLTGTVNWKKPTRLTPASCWPVPNGSCTRLGTSWITATRFIPRPAVLIRSQPSRIA